jgi:hypothetical protein
MTDFDTLDTLITVRVCVCKLKTRSPAHQVAYLSLTDFVNEREVKKETQQVAEREARKLQKARAAPAKASTKASTKGFGK